MSLAVLLLAVTLPAFGQATVQRIEVRVTIEGIAPHPLIRERLQATAESVVERLLVGRPLDQLLPLQPRLGETVAGVLERVAAGYSVAAATVQLGVTSTMTLQLRPVGTVMREVVLRTELRTVHPKVAPLVTGLLRGSEGELQALIIGLPVAAMDWAEPLIAQRARQLVEDALPGFTGAVRIRPGEVAIVDLAVEPRDSRIIRNIGVRFRSSSIPTILLQQNAPQVASMAEPLRGLPVVFAESQHKELARLINDELNAYQPVLDYRIVATAGLEVAETTYVTVVADSLLYRGRVEAQLNVGTGAPGPAIVAHLGRLVAPGTELYVEMSLVPNTLSFGWEIGAQYALTPDTNIGLTYATASQDVLAWTTLRLGRDVSLRGTWNVTRQGFEGGATYRLNEFLSGELVGTSRGEIWLRLISNL